MVSDIFWWSKFRKTLHFSFNKTFLHFDRHFYFLTVYCLNRHLYVVSIVFLAHSINSKYNHSEQIKEHCLNNWLQALFLTVIANNAFGHLWPTHFRVNHLNFQWKIHDVMTLLYSTSRATSYYKIIESILYTECYSINTSFPDEYITEQNIIYC